MGMAVTRDDSVAEKLRFLQFGLDLDITLTLIIHHAAGGAVPSPFDCFLVNRGLKTLHGASCFLSKPVI